MRIAYIFLLFLGVVNAAVIDAVWAQGRNPQQKIALLDDANKGLPRSSETEKQPHNINVTSGIRADNWVLFYRGWFYETRSGVSDCDGDGCLSKAIDFYKHAAERGSARAAIKLGHIYKGTSGIPQDLVQARKWFKTAAELGDAVGLVNQAKLLVDERYNSARSLEHYQEAERLLQTAIGFGSAWAADYLVWVYESQPEHFKCPAGNCIARVIDQYTRAAASGSAQAALNLGKIYRDGKKLPMDLVEADRWFRTTVELGDDDGLVQQADLLVNKRYNSSPSESDRRKALQLLDAAQSMGNAAALAYLGHLYETNTGVVDCSGNVCLDKAIGYYTRAIAGKNAPAAIRLGKIYRDGRGLPKDGVMAPDLLKNGTEPVFRGDLAVFARMFAGNQGETARAERQVNTPTSRLNKLQRTSKRWALFYLGRMNETEIGVDDCFGDECRKKAAVYYEHAANLGHAGAAMALGKFHLAGDRMTRNRTLARKWFQKAAKLGDTDGLLFQASLLIDKRYNTGQVPKEHKYARKLLVRAGNEGNARALIYLGWMYETRSGITDCSGETCNARAIEFYRQALDGGYLPATEYIRSNRRRQNGIPKDLVEADILFAKAAALGNSNGLVHQANLRAKTSYNRRASQQGYRQALSFLTEARGRGNIWALNYLGWMYEQKRGMDTCEGNTCLTKAIELYKLAANRGFLQAVENVGLMYQNLYRRKKDEWWHYGEAYEWFEKAANQGDSDGFVLLATLIADSRYGSKRTPDECKRAADLLERAKGRGNTWAPKVYHRLFTTSLCRTKSLHNRRHRYRPTFGYIKGARPHSWKTLHRKRETDW